MLGAALAALGSGGGDLRAHRGIEFRLGHRRDSAAVALGVVLLVAFVMAEAPKFATRGRTPMMPLRLFRSRQFDAANAVTVAGLRRARRHRSSCCRSSSSKAPGTAPLRAGASLLPVTAMLLLLSARMGKFASRHGPRLQMTIGPIIAGGRHRPARADLDPGANYFAAVLPGVLVFGVGIAITVAPLTATVMAAAPPADVGVGFGGEQRCRPHRRSLRGRRLAGAGGHHRVRLPVTRRADARVSPRGVHCCRGVRARRRARRASSFATTC